MIVYQETKKKFLNDVRLDLIEEKIERKVFERLHKKKLNIMNFYLG